MLQAFFLQPLSLVHDGDDVNVVAWVVDNPPRTGADLVQVVGSGFRYALVRAGETLQAGSLV